MKTFKMLCITIAMAQCAGTHANQETYKELVEIVALEKFEPNTENLQKFTNKLQNYELDYSEPTYGSSILHIVSEEHLIEYVQALLERGANANVALKWGTTPLHYAAKKGDQEIALALLAAGARLDVYNQDSFCPFLTAIFHGRNEWLKKMVITEKGGAYFKEHVDILQKKVTTKKHHELIALLEESL